MTDTMHRPGEKVAEAAPPARAALQRRDRLGPLGYGSGPVLAAGIMAGGALLFAGWGATQLLTSDRSPASEAAAVSPHEEGTVTLTLPDRNRNGVPDAFEDKPGNGGSTDSRGQGTSTSGRGDEDKPAQVPEPTPQPVVYVIQRGDTLTAISQESGVPIGVLVEENRIQDPNFIYAGASLLIPPKA
ncbi:LysM peptidoglycan-binding domain-containing protein [Pseudarthrobacter sp. NPDC058196]|uniref:LysM peptidoglycan-binding domain-containing protein n=1 Tax=Pseudarthrobacter sp. NPDC058196 TaxID=3346376 RepID=UPI0036DC9EBF